MKKPHAATIHYIISVGGREGGANRRAVTRWRPRPKDHPYPPWCVFSPLSSATHTKKRNDQHGIEIFPCSSDCVATLIYLLPSLPSIDIMTNCYLYKPCRIRTHDRSLGPPRPPSFVLLSSSHPSVFHLVPSSFICSLLSLLHILTPPRQYVPTPDAPLPATTTHTSTPRTPPFLPYLIRPHP